MLITPSPQDSNINLLSESYADASAPAHISLDALTLPSDGSRTFSPCVQPIKSRAFAVSYERLLGLEQSGITNVFRTFRACVSSTATAPLLPKLIYALPWPSAIAPSVCPPRLTSPIRL